MMKNFLLTIIALFLLHPDLTASKFFTMNWYWGIEDIKKREQFFIVNIKPEFKLKSFMLKFDIPVQINSNRRFVDNHWNSQYDIITKIDYFSYTNDIFDLKIKTLNNIMLGNGELVYDYSCDLFDPLLIKKGLITRVRISSFNISFIIDDLIDYDLFFLEAGYKYKRFRTGVALAYDDDIFDPYLEKPVDQGGRISSLNLFINYDLFRNEKIRLIIENDLIKHFKTYQFDKNLNITSGLNMSYSQWMDLAVKFKYYQKKTPQRIIFNKFYDIERSVINENLSDKDLFGFSTRLGFFIKKYFNISFFIEKVDTLLPYTIIKLKNLEEFPTKIRFSLELYSRLNEKWYHIFNERGKSSFLLLKSSVPLSVHLSLNLDYLKSFKYKNDDLTGLNQTLFYMEFIF